MIEALNAALGDRYRIEREVGAGGMATVFVADDLKHGRTVALKVLKPELAAVLGGGRFLAEIRTTAKLQHPNILPLFDSGDAGGLLYYVMPYVEGESLRELLDREVQLSVDAAVRIARSVAGALQAAHDEGVIHRDIKPENILLSRGEPLVADFGIALAVSQAGGGRLTETGLSVGTPYYMSPEQAAADRDPGQAADIYSLGCVLYEMLVGEPPFTGASAQAVLARILTEHPRPVAVVRHTVPPNVADAVARALERLPADRFERADDFARALADPGFRHTSAPGAGANSATGESIPAVTSGATPGRDGTSWGRLAAGGVALLAAGVVLGVLGARSSGPASAPERPFQTQVAMPEGQAPMDTPFGSSLSISDDGQTLVYAGVNEGSGTWQLWIRRAGLLDATPVPGSSGAFTPVMSPDGDAVGFSTPDGDLVVVDLATGARRVLTGNVNFVADWGVDEQIYFADTYARFFRIPARGGAVEELPGFNPDPGQISGSSITWAWGEVLPGGTHGVWTRVPLTLDLGQTLVGVVDFATGDFEVLAQGSSPHYLETGHLAWTSSGGVVQVAAFDLDRRELTGATFPVLEGVRIDAGAAAAFVTFSQQGDMVYRPGGANSGGMRPVRLDPDGEVVVIDSTWAVMPAAAGNWSGLAVSPDGDRMVTTDGTGGGSNLWVKELFTDAPPFRITFEADFNVRPRWSADGDTIFYISSAGDFGLTQAPDRTEIWARAADGSGSARRVLRADSEIEEVAPSPAGEWLVYRQGGTLVGRDIFAVRLDGEGEPLAVAATEADEKSPQVSPDGRWVAYVSDATGRPEVFVRPFPDVDGGVFQISQGGGVSPVWSRSGDRLYYLSIQEGLALMSARMAVDGRTIRPSGRAPVFGLTSQYVDPNYLSFDVMPDDGGFVFYSLGDQNPGNLVWYRNWLPAWRARAGRGVSP